MLDRTVATRLKVAATAAVVLLPFVAGAAPASATAAPSAGAPYVSLQHKTLANAKVKAGKALSFTVLGVHGVPKTGLSAVVLTVAVTSPASSGSLVVYGAGARRPAVTSVSLVKGHPSASDVVVVPGSKGRVTVYNASPSTAHVVVTARAYYAAPGTVKATRATTGFVRLTQRELGSVAVGAKGSATLTALGKVGVPKTGVAGVVVSITVTAPTLSGALVVFPYGSKAPKKSTLSLHAGRAVTASAVLRPGAKGRVELTNRSADPVHVSIDVVGYLLTLHTPGAPRSVTAVAAAAAAVVTWKAPLSNGGAPITAYRVVASPGGASVTVSSGLRTVTVPGLAVGTAYRFTVRAVNSRGIGTTSQASAAVTPIGVPSAPTAVTAAMTGAAQATVSFTPGSANGSPITSYRIASTDLALSASGTGSPIVVTGLRTGKAYTFTVTATNAVGASPVSAASNVAIGEGFSLVSVSTQGVAADADADTASISADGRFVVFRSVADNLVPITTNGFDNIYVRDRLLGTTALVSVGVGGGAAAGSSQVPVISRDGRYVLFYSSAGNLVAGDINGKSDLFLRDLQSGTTTLLSQANGVEGNDNSYSGSFSADGSTVVFTSKATNLGATDTHTFEDVFALNLATRAIVRVSVGTGGADADNDSQDPSVSGNGRYVTWESSATNLVAGVPTGGFEQVYRRDLTTGVTSMVSVVGTTAGNAFSGFPVISDDARYVAFLTDATNLGTTDTSGDVLAADSTTGAITPVSVNAAKVKSDNENGLAGFTGDDRIVYDSAGDNLVPGDMNMKTDIFLTNWLAGTVVRLTVTATGAESNGHSVYPQVTPDGKHVAFDSTATNLVAGVPGADQDNLIVDDLG